MEIPLIAAAVVFAAIATGITDWRVLKPAGMAGRRYRWPALPKIEKKGRPLWSGPLQVSNRRAGQTL